MNRRSFLSAMLRAGTAAAVLPAAVTYARVWIPERKIITDIGVYAQLQQCEMIQFNPWQDTISAYLREVMRVVERQLLIPTELIVHESDVPHVRRLLRGLA